MAWAEDGSIEAIAHRSLRWERLDGHPERCLQPAPLDVTGIKESVCMRAIILAAGRGSRMKALTSDKTLGLVAGQRLDISW